MKKLAIMMWVITTASTAVAAQSPSSAEADPYPGVDYNQKYRPQFHFTSKRNWLNDPNGMVYYDGQYHLFFQHNPSGLHWANMHWGHAVSKDMIHWKQIRHAIYPYAGGAIWSGSGTVDWRNTTGFGKSAKDAPKPIVLCYSHARHPFTQHIAYSIDRGRTWALHKGNPVVGNQGVSTGERDPKILRHEPTKKWVMVLCLRKGLGRIFTSDDLKKWDVASDITGRWFKDCPDLFELPVDGDEKKTKWVLYDASFTYSVGMFDGKTFKIEETPGRGDLGRNFSAAQTFNDAPDPRRIQIAWMRGSDFAAKGMPFNQQMSFPCELTLRTTDEGIRLYRWPVKEIESLYKKKHELKKAQLKPGDNPLKDIKAELIDLYADITMGSAKKVVFNLRGSTVAYDGYTLTSGTLRKGRTVDGLFCPDLSDTNDWDFPANRWGEGDCEFTVTFEVHPKESRPRGYSGPNGPVITIADVGSLGLWGRGTYLVVGGSSSPDAMKPFPTKLPASMHDGKPHTLT
ncbi:MAG: glycoside hydrolase family 32 protein, partial [Planctomycetota bacterium]